MQLDDVDVSKSDLSLEEYLKWISSKTTYLSRADEAVREDKVLMVAISCPTCHYCLPSENPLVRHQGVQECQCEDREVARASDIIAALAPPEWNIERLARYDGPREVKW